MESKIKFKVIFSKEAGELISSIPEKARRKVLYNIDKVAHGEMDKELFKNIGEYGYMGALGRVALW